MINEIRPYGPGKFSTILDAYVYSVSLEGSCDAEAGDVQENGHWYGLMRHGHTIWSDADQDREALNETEQEYLRACAGAILAEDSQGFVYVTYFDAMEALDAAWEAIEAEISEYDARIAREDRAEAE